MIEYNNLQFDIANDTLYRFFITLRGVLILFAHLTCNFIKQEKLKKYYEL